MSHISILVKQSFLHALIAFLLISHLAFVAAKAFRMKRYLEDVIKMWVMRCSSDVFEAKNLWEKRDLLMDELECFWTNTT